MSGVPPTRPERRNVWLFVVGGLLVALGLAFFVSPYASGDPDGLDKVATDQGFAGASGQATAEGPLAGYEVEGVDDGSLSTGVAGIVGVALTFGAAMILFGALRVATRRSDGGADRGAATDP